MAIQDQMNEELSQKIIKNSSILLDKYRKYNIPTKSLDRRIPGCTKLPGRQHSQRRDNLSKLIKIYHII